MQDALKSIFAPMFEAALKGELGNHLGYVSYGTVFMDTDDGEYRKIVFDEDKVDIFAGHMIYEIRDRKA